MRNAIKMISSKMKGDLEVIKLDGRSKEMLNVLKEQIIAANNTVQIAKLKMEAIMAKREGLLIGIINSAGGDPSKYTLTPDLDLIQKKEENEINHPPLSKKD